MTITQPEYRAHIIYLDPFKVTVREGLERYRKDMGEVKSLAESIRSKGQIHPITITKNHELVAGGRRLAATMLLGIEVACVCREDLTDLQLRELEYEENFQRKDFTPAEEVEAIASLHKLKQEIYGTTTSGREGGWTLDDTAKTIGKTRGTVIDALHLAKAVKAAPELAGAKDKSTIRKAVKAMAKVVQHVEAVTAVEQAKTSNPETFSFNLRNTDGLKDMTTVPDNSIDLLLTDPPYGVDIFSQTSESNLPQYDDSKEAALAFYQELAIQSVRFCKPTSHAYVFCSIDHFHQIRQMFIDAGWDTHIKPIIWIKRETGQNNWPTRYPSHCYELILYARGKDATLIKQGYPDWVQCDAIIDSSRVHQAQKPIALLRELIARSVLPLSSMYDPCAGSGSSLLAGLEENLIVSGCEINEAAYAGACKHYAQWNAARKERS